MPDKAPLILHWDKKPRSGKRVAILIPQYNEASNGPFEERLAYFHKLAHQCAQTADIILIDDGSKDDSRRRIAEYRQRHDSSWYFAWLEENGNKIGALYCAVRDLDHDYILFSDFDTNLEGLRHLDTCLHRFDADSQLMGGYFQLIPDRGHGIIFNYQVAEYARARCWYKFYEKSRLVAVLPGAGCILRNTSLKKILSRHSGLRNGEDRETTVIGLQMDWRVIYCKHIQAMTKTPPTFGALLRQRRRWYLGYLETMQKEKHYYFAEIKRRSFFGQKAAGDLFFVLFVILFPFACIALALLSPALALSLALAFYALDICSTIVFFKSVPGELEKFPFPATQFLLFPLIKVSLESICWMSAVLKFAANTFSGNIPRAGALESRISRKIPVTAVRPDAPVTAIRPDIPPPPAAPDPFVIHRTTAPK